MVFVFLNGILVKGQRRAGSDWDEGTKPYLHTTSALFHPSQCPERKKKYDKKHQRGESMTSDFVTWQI